MRDVTHGGIPMRKGFVVVEAVNVPDACHGVISRYLLRVGVGVYVGSLSLRVRILMWEQACAKANRGTLTLVYPSATPQGFTLESTGHPAPWLLDFDGLVFLRLPLRKPDVWQLNRDRT